jgi:hypothetical protein
MLHVPVFWALLIATTGLAFGFGGGPERWTAAMFMVAAVLTRLSFEPAAHRFYEVEILTMTIDMALLAGLLIIVVLSDRYWPICMVALHAFGVAAHVARAMDPDLVRKAYSIALAAPSYLMLPLLLAATWRHQRRLRTSGADRSWNGSFVAPPATRRRMSRRD